MPLARYLEPGKLELVKRKVESSTGIWLKTVPQWLISKKWFKEQQKVSNNQGSVLVITVSNK